MAYSITFWQFSKKENSTARPTATGLDFSCKLKDDTPLLAPTIILEWANQLTDPQIYNYAYISEFSRYYFVTDWRFKFGLWECSLTVDVLASWKTEIGTQSMYVLRSASSFDTAIPDKTYPIKTGATFSAETNNLNPFAASYSQGYFVCGIINGDSGSVGAVSYYVFTSAEFRAFASYLLGNNAYWGLIEISDQLMKLLYNPFQYVVSCTWLPVSPPMGAAVASVPVGWWDIPVSATRLSGSVRASGSATVQIPKHPGGATRTYLLDEPFSSYYLDFPPFGNFSIPAGYLTTATTIDFQWDCDCITGIGRLMMGADNAAKPFNIVSGAVGVDIQLAQMGINGKQIMQQAIPDTKYDWLDTALNMLGNIGSAWIAKQTPMQTTGGNGGFSAGYYPIRLTGIFVNPAPENIAEFGRPLCNTVTLNTLTGFVQCAHADFEIPAYASEIAEIGNYLTSGFFYE